MSEYDDHERERRKAADTQEAVVRTARWSPWVWIVPAVAIFVAGYLVIRYGFFGGGDITVKFAEARGLDRYSPVRFRGAKVGTVQKITIDENLGAVVVRISMDASMNHALRKGTKFWIQESGLENGGLGGLLSGTSVGISPGDGDETREFVGQEYAPILTPPAAGKTVILDAATGGSVAPGAPVEFQGIRVGRILGAEYNPARRVTEVHAFVVQRFAGYVRQGTRFWRGGGLNVSLGGGGVSLGGGGGIGALLTSPVSFYTPEVLPGAEVAQGTHFQLYESEGPAMAAVDGGAATYATYFAGSVHGLTPGTAVMMKGVQVGRVRDVRLHYVPETATLITPVTFTIDPAKMELPISATSAADVRAAMNDAMSRLVQKGLRASLNTSLVLPGASGISLEMTGRPGTARLDVSQDPPVVPSAAGGSGLEGVMSAVNGIAGRIQNLPIEEIAGHLRSTAQRLDTIVHDRTIDESLQRLNRSLADVERITATTRENIGPIAHSVRNAAASAETTAKTLQENVAPIAQSLRNAAAAAEGAAGRAQQLLGTQVQQNYDLGALIKELTRAAEAVRGLANYLEENPDALLKGRGKAK